MLRDAQGFHVDPAERLRARALASPILSPAQVESATGYVRWHMAPGKGLTPAGIIAFAQCLGVLLAVLPHAERAVSHGGPTTRHGSPDSSDPAERAYALSHLVLETAFLVCSEVRP